MCQLDWNDDICLLAIDSRLFAVDSRLLLSTYTLNSQLLDTLLSGFHSVFNFQETKVVKLNMASSSMNSTDENINVLSQSSDLHKEALDEIEKKAQAKNTTKAVYILYILMHC